MDYNDLLNTVRKLAAEVGEAQLTSAVFDATGVHHAFGDVHDEKHIVLGAGQDQTCTLKYAGSDSKYTGEQRATKPGETSRGT